MEFYKLYNTPERRLDYLKEAMRNQIPSIVDFGTAMINKRKRRNKRNRYE